MNNVGAGVPFTGVDVRKRRCAGCGREFLPPGAGGAMCSDACWVASRGRQVSQGESLSRSWAEATLRRERRIAGRARVDRTLAAAALDNDVAAYRRSRTETMGLISRLQSRADPYARFASRGPRLSGVSWARSPVPAATAMTARCAAPTGRSPA